MNPKLSRSPAFGTLAVLGSAVGFGLSPLLASRALATGISAAGASLLRVAIVLVVLLPTAPRLRRWPRSALISAAGGAANGLGIVAFYSALENAPVEAATAVYYTYPLFMLAFSMIVMSRPTRPSEWGRATSIVAGAMACAVPITLSSESAGFLLLATAAPLAWSIYLLLLAGPLADMPTLPKVFSGAAGATAVLLPINLTGSGLASMTISWSAVIAVALLAVFSLAVPASLVTWGAPRAGERTTAFVGSFELVVALVSNWLFLNGRFTLWQAVGVGVILVAAMTSRRRSGHRQPPATSRQHSRNEMFDACGDQSRPQRGCALKC